MIKYFPERVQFEMTYGCNARCIMCPVHEPSERRRGIMPTSLFKKIVDQLEPFKGGIKKFDLWALGEPLMDKEIDIKIRYAKDKGFKNLAIATNTQLLVNEIQDKLIASRLDTIIFSIDGVNKNTHENIRKGLNFDVIISNAKSIINKRNKSNSKMRFVFRFIRQESNRHEWPLFQKYWEDFINKEKGDVIIGYDVHSWGGEIDTSTGKDDQDEINIVNNKVEKLACHHIFDRIIILQDGTIPMCCSDMHKADYKYGNVKIENIISIFNNKQINKVRKLHLKGKKNNMKICKDCTILQSEYSQDVLSNTDQFFESNNLKQAFNVA